MSTDYSGIHAAQLRDSGLRVTPSRLAILAAVGELPGHPTAEVIMGVVRNRLGSISTQAAYDILHALTAAGLLRRIEPAGSAARYESRVGDNHHHLVCSGCGSTRDVDCAVGAAPCLEPSDAAGFEITEAEVIFWGLCPDCQKKHLRLQGVIDESP